MKVVLKWISIKNFKGIRDKRVEFTDRTSIFAANGVGKTSILDAFMWDFFGKDSTGRSDFGIKPAKADGTYEKNLDNEVEAGIEVDGREVKVKRIQRENWVTKRGESEPEFKGHTVEYFWDDTPQKAGEFKSRIDGIMPENLFKLITNPLYFNSLDWKERRAALMSLVGDISNDAVVDSMSALFNEQQTLDLVNMLNSGKALADWKRELALKKSKLKEELERIPSRIDEVTLSMPQGDFDFKKIETSVDLKLIEIAKVDLVIEDKAKAFQEASKAIQEKQKVIHSLNVKKNEIVSSITQREGGRVLQSKTELNELLSRITYFEGVCQRSSARRDELTNKRGLLEDEQALLRQKWADVNADNSAWNLINSEELVFDEHKFSCPTCSRAFEADDIDLKKAEMRRGFLSDKQRRLDKVVSDKQQDLISISAHGKKKAEEVATYVGLVIEATNEVLANEEQLNQLKDQAKNKKLELDALMSEASTVSEIIESDPEYLSIVNQIAALNSEVNEQPEVDYDDLKSKRSAMLAELELLKLELNNKSLIERGNNRIAELKGQESNYAQQKALLERQEYAIDVFNKMKIDLIESRVNERFQHVKFRMFKEQINGGEAECCDTLLNGVAFPDVNTAGKIAAGLDIINTFANHHNRYAPIFIDNRESVTEIPYTESQVVSLIVSPGDKQLRIA